MSDWTYEPPESEEFVATLQEHLRHKGHSKLVEALEGGHCRFEHHGQFSRRAHAYWAEASFELPVEHAASLSDADKAVLLEAADEVMPSKVGYDLNEISITPILKRTDSDSDYCSPARADSFLHALAQQAALDGDEPLVAALASATASIRELYPDERYDYIHCMYSIELAPSHFAEFKSELSRLEESIRGELFPIWRIQMPHRLQLDRVEIGPATTVDPEWRKNAKGYLFDGGINNQGNVRSDNPAMLEEDGLYFRSKPEINLYYALKSNGLSFAPLPVFLRGGDTYNRIECDFVVLFEGLMFIIEVDGDAFHDERPVDAHSRTSMLTDHGAIELRIEARRCQTRSAAQRCLKNLIERMNNHKKSRT